MQGSSISLFIYGTLLYPKIRAKVIGRDCTSETAVLQNYSRHCIAKQCYPGLNSNEGQHTQGALLHGITAAECLALDTFEGKAYQRIPVLCITADQQEHAAHTYLYRHDVSSNDLWIPDLDQEAELLQRWFDKN